MRSPPLLSDHSPTTSIPRRYAEEGASISIMGLLRNCPLVSLGESDRPQAWAVAGAANSLRSCLTLGSSSQQFRPICLWREDVDGTERSKNRLHPVQVHREEQRIL